MKRLLLLALLTAAGFGAATAAPVEGRVKSVILYPSGAYVTLSVPVTLKGGMREEVVFPDLWYADRQTVEVRLAPETRGEGVTFAPEVAQVDREARIQLYKTWNTSRAHAVRELERLRADSLVLAQEANFLQANARRETRSTTELTAAQDWMRKQYAELYEKQRGIKDSVAMQNMRIEETEAILADIAGKKKDITLVSAWVDAPGPREVEFEISYFAKAAEWKPVYFFRFDPSKSAAALEYQAILRQWSGFKWDSVPATLGYGSPLRTPTAGVLHRRTVSYEAPAPRRAKGDLAVDVGKFGGTYTGEAYAESEADAGYQLGTPLSLYSSSFFSGQIYQTVDVWNDTLPVTYGYEVTPMTGGGEVILTAYLPGWQKLHLRDGRMNVFYDGRMLGQSNLRVSGEQSDTLSIPLSTDPLVTVKRQQTKDYQSKGPNKTTDQNREYELRVRNDKAFPIDLIMRDQYPVASSDQLKVTLTGTSGAEVDPRTGILLWRLRLAPGEARTLRFGYTVRYPREGNISL